jgi:hypothetical protein
MIKNIAVRKKVLVLVFSTLVPLYMTGQPLFSKLIGNDKKQVFSRAVFTHTKEIVFTGYSQEKEYPYTHLGTCIGKLDTAGNLLWMHRLQPYDEDKRLFINDIIQPTDGGFFMCGEVINSKNRDGVFIKTDDGGNIQWYKRYDPSGAHYPGEILKRVIQTVDGGYVAIGNNGAGWNDYDLMWIRLDAAGNVLHSHRFGNQKMDWAISIFTAESNGFYIVSSVGSLYPTKDVFPRIYAVDSTGELLWSKSIYLKFAGNVTDCIKTLDGGYALCGNGLEASYVLKLDAAFNFSWMQKYPLANFKSLCEGQNGNIYLSRLYQVGSNSWKSGIIKLNASGTTLSNLQIGNNYVLWVSTDQLINISSNTVFYMNTNSDSSDEFSDILAFNMNQNGLTECNAQPYTLLNSPDEDSLEHYDEVFITDSIPMEVITDSLQVFEEDSITDLCSATTVWSDQEKSAGTNAYPNPTRDYLNIELPVENPLTEYRLIIYDELGRKAMDQVVHPASLLTIQVSNLKKGLYFFELRSTTGKNTIGKFLIE